MTGVSLHERYDFVVLGAGVAGLAAAYKLSQGGKSVLVLEKDKQVGGLARTLDIEGFRFDYCAHRFHSPDPELMRDIRTMMGENFSEHMQKSRILMFKKYLKYPFELQNLLRAMPVMEAALCGIDFGINMLTKGLRKGKKLDSYRDWFIHFFGRRLYRVMCEPYTRKIWGRDPSLISSDWADQRFAGPNIMKLIKKTFKKMLRLDFSSYSLQDSALAPDSGKFYYPKRGGIQAMPDRFAECVTERGSHVLSGTKITAIDPQAKEVTFIYEGAEHRVKADDSIITTIPLHAYAALLPAASVPEDVTEALRGLKYMDIIFVLLFINRESISNDTWLYFPDPKIAFNRAVEFKNWSLTMAPAGKTSLCLDITVTPANTELCAMSDEALIEKCKRDCEDTALCPASATEKGIVVRVPNAYPVYDLDYRKKLTTIVNFFESPKNIFCLGRTGIFRYQNSDGAIDMAFELARRLLDPAEQERSIFKYSMKGVSY